MRRTLAFGLAALSVALTAASPAVSQTPAPVLATGADEYQPAVSAAYLAWTESPRAYPDRHNVYARAEGQRRFKVNARGTVATTSAGAIDGTRLVYGERPTVSEPGDLKFFDLLARSRSDPPVGVNTRRYGEGLASVSGSWLLFGRYTLSRHEQSGVSLERIILFNLTTREARQLDSARGSALAQPGSVQGNYATWFRCPRPNRCNVYVYDIAARTTSSVPNPFRKSQYANSVTAAGVVYFAESNSLDCGSGLALWRYPLGGTRSQLLSFPRNRDVGTTSPRINPDGTTTLFFDRYRCGTEASDILKLELGR